MGKSILSTNKCLGSPKNGLPMRGMTCSDIFLSFLFAFFLPLVVQASSKWFLIPSWSLFGSILSSQDDIQNLQNLDFSQNINRFLNIHRLQCEVGLRGVLELSWAPLEPRSWLLSLSWAAPGLLLGTLEPSFGPLGRLLAAKTDFSRNLAKTIVF